MLGYSVIKTNELESLKKCNKQRGETINHLQKNLVSKSKRIDALFTDKYDLIDEKENLLTNFRIRRAVLGKRGSGKTTFVQQKLLPTLKNYYIICLHGEYESVARENKFDYDFTLSVADNKEEIYAAIEANQHKVIIIDDYFAMNLNYNIFDSFVKKYNLNFILITASMRHFSKYLVDEIDYFHTTSFENLVQDYNFSHQKIDFCKINVIRRK